MKKNNLMSGAFILSVGGVMAKIFSAVYRIVLTRILGGEGIGLYQLIFPFYSLCVVLATAGLPLAISKVVAKNQGNEKSVIKKCFLFTSTIALILSFVLIISSKGLATLQGQSQLSVCYLILAPTIIFVSLSSVLRGYFQGKHHFTPSSISNIVEQFIKLCVGLILSLSLISVSLIAAIIGSVVAIAVSEILSLFILLLYIKKEKLNSAKTVNLSFKALVKDILPITLTNIILPLSTFIDSVLVVNLLSVNFSKDISIFLYGLESGVVSSLVSIPTIFSFAIASVILPNIANANHEISKNHKLTLAIKIVLLITIPCVEFFTIIPNRLISVLYHNRLNAFGIDGLKIASSLLAVSGFGVVFLAINQVYSSGLQAVEQRFVTIRNLTISVIIKFILVMIFMPSKVLNIYTLAIANTICYVSAMLLNHFEIKQNFKLKIDYWFWAKIIFSNVVTVFAVVAILSVKNSVANTLFAIIVGVVVYLGCLVVTNVLDKKDKAMFKYKV